MKILICENCRLILGTRPFLRVTTEVAIRVFCVKCIKKAFVDLQGKPDKDPGEVSLVTGMRKFLAKHKALD